MKFSEQVTSYQRALTRKSRFFGSIMMVSGISLAAVSPFLSNEISKIECDTIAVEASRGNSDKVNNLTIELQEKDLLVDRLTKELVSKEDEIDRLVSTPDCDAAVRTVKAERDRLNAELNNLEAQAEANQIALNRCQAQLEECSMQQPVEPTDCTKYTDEIRRLNVRIREKDNEIARLTRPQQLPVKCPSVYLLGYLRPNEVFTFNGNDFMIKLNSDDVGALYYLYHNKKNVTSSIKNLNKDSYYSFKDGNGNSYQINFLGPPRNRLKFSLTSK